MAFIAPIIRVHPCRTMALFFSYTYMAYFSYTKLQRGGAMTILVHPRVLRKRPWLDEREMLSTWMGAARLLPSQGEYEPNQKMAIGWD